MVTEVEKSFPRGGLSKKRKERDELEGLPSSKKKKSEDLFAPNKVKAKKNKKSKKNVENKKKKNSLSSTKEDGFKIVRASSLSYEELFSGMKVLGIVDRVEKYKVHCRLPDRLGAVLPITKISRLYNESLKKLIEDPELSIPSLEALFPVGSVLPLSVVDVVKDKRHCVTVSAEPDFKMSLNYLCIGTRLNGVVSSVEDHGYIIDIGTPAVKAFLPNRNTKSDKFLVGQLLPVSVVEKNTVSNTVSLSLKKRSVIEPPESIHSIIPGMRLSAKFIRRIKGGLMLSFGTFEGIVPYPHYDYEEKYDEESVLEASVLYVAPTVNTVYLSLKPEVYTGGLVTSPDDVRAGDMLNSCKVTSVTSGGLYLISESGSVVIHVNPRQTQEKSPTLDELKSSFPVGTVIKAVRLTHYDRMTGVFMGSLKKSSLKKSFIDVNSLSVGDFVTAKIVRFTSYGVVVAFGDFVSGYIKNIHLSDIPLKQPELKYSPGDELKCRVLKLASGEFSKINLTSKSLLVDENCSIVDSYDTNHVGVITEGVVVIINSKGLLMELFNGVQGFIPKNLISEKSVENPEKLFYIGQVLKCQVRKVSPEISRMTLSLVLRTKKDKSKENKVEGLALGSKYDCYVTDVTSEALSVEVESDDARKIKGIIPMEHLTDNVFLAPYLLKTYSVGDVIKNALCLELKLPPVLTLKKSFLDFDMSCFKSLEDIQEGVIFPVIVERIKDFGAFVRLPPIVKSLRSGLIPKKNVADFFVKDVEDVLNVGMTLYAKVTGLKNKKIELSSKLSDVSEGGKAVTDFIKDLDEDYKRVREMSEHNLSSYYPGMVVSGNFIEKTSHGIRISIEHEKDSHISGIITNTNLDAHWEDDKSSIPSVVLFSDFENGVLELSNDVDLVSEITLRKNRMPKENQTVSCRPLWTRAEFPFVLAVVESPKYLKGLVIKIASKKHINDWIGISDKIGEACNVVIKDRFLGIGRVAFNVTESKKNAIIQTNTKKKKVKESISKDCVQENSDDQDECTEMEVDDDKVEKEEVLDWEDEDFNPWGKGSLLSSIEPKEDNEDANKEKKKSHISKKEKKALDKLERMEIERAEELVIKGEEPIPMTKDEFEKHILGAPDSSLRWIQYVAFHADKGEIDLARQIVKRALEKINFREEEERFNVYMAWFNLENSVNSEEEVDKLLREILRYNNEYKVYDRVAHIYATTGKPDRALEILKTMVRKFPKEIVVWTKLGTHFFESAKNLKEARFTLQRAIQNLDKRNHVEVTVKFAQMEFKYGEIERGKTIFETVLNNFPKRTDLWNVYADTLIKAEEIEAARNLFERMITLNLQPKKMKQMFKKYIDFEIAQNDEFKVDRIRKKALEYVESKVGAIEED